MKDLIFPIMLSHVPLGALVELVDLSAASAQEIAKSLHTIRRSESHDIIEYRIRPVQLIHRKISWWSGGSGKNTGKEPCEDDYATVSVAEFN